MHQTAGFVLVGGRSSRMGKEKARLKVGNEFLVEVVARKVAEAAGNVTLVGSPEAFTDLPFASVKDMRPGLGPIAGLEAALTTGQAELNLVTGCDMPDLHPSDLLRLLAAAANTGALCTLARDRHARRHPLCAVYRSEALPVVRAALDAGRLRLLALVEELKAVEVRIDSVVSNLNTPEQWAAWQAEQPVRGI